MNTNIVTIGNYLPQYDLNLSSSVKSDVKSDAIKFSVAKECNTKMNEAFESAKADNIKKKCALRENEETDTKTTDSSETKEDEKTNSDDNSMSETDDINLVMEYKVSVDSLLKEAAENIEQKRENGVNELLESSEEVAALPLDEEIIGVDENQELSQYSEEMQQRLKAILLGESQNLIEDNANLQNEFVETIINKVGDEVVNADNLLMNSESAAMSEKAQTIINEARAASELSDIEGNEQIDNGDSNEGILATLKSNKEALLENLLNNANENNNGVVGKVSELMEESVGDGIDLQTINGRESLEKSVFNTELPAEEQVEVDKTNENSLDMKEFAQTSSALNKNSGINEQDIMNVQNAARKNEEFLNYNSNDDVGSEIKEDLSQNDSQTLTIDQEISFNENTRVNDSLQQNSTSEVNDSVAKQILESIQSSIANQTGDKQVTVRLNPPELGEVVIKFQEQESEITGLLEVSKTQTRAEIEQALPQIIRSLSDTGIDIKRLEVVLSNSEQYDNNTSSENSLFNNEQQQHDFDDSGMYEYERDKTTIHDWLSSRISYDSNSDSQNALTVDNSINILI